MSHKSAWQRGAPSNDLEAAGVLIHVLDGGGITMDGFVGGGIPTAAEMWAGLGNDGGGYRWKIR